MFVNKITQIKQVFWINIPVFYSQRYSDFIQCYKQLQSHAQHRSTETNFWMNFRRIFYKLRATSVNQKAGILGVELLLY